MAFLGTKYGNNLGISLLWMVGSSRCRSGELADARDTVTIILGVRRLLPCFCQEADLPSQRGIAPHAPLEVWQRELFRSHKLWN